MESRLCLKNLPKGFHSSDLRAFIFEQCPKTQITDCHVVFSQGRSRRMGFCGFATADMAQFALKRLNKAYCKTSRLVVEPARPKPKNESALTIVVRANEEKPKQPTKMEEPKDDKIQRKKREFLAVMGAGAEKETKFWANDEAAAPLEDNDASLSGSGGSDDNDSDSDEVDPISSHIPHPSVTSDSDFLRSKQVDKEDLEAEDDAGSLSSDCSESDQAVPMKPSKEESTPSLNPQEESEDSPKEKEAPLAPKRLFLRNLPFSTIEDDVRAHLESFGTIRECHVPVDDLKRSKGFGFVTFSSAAAATRALEQLDGTDFQGRLLQVCRARQAKSASIDLSHLPYKERREKMRQMQAEDTMGWSASFVRGDAVLDNLSERLGLHKGDVLAVKDGLSAGDAAVRLALGETAVIEENRKYFAEHGYNMEALVTAGTKDASVERSHTALLIKNLPHDTSKEELLKIIATAGETPARLLLPPSRTVAVAEYKHGNDAKRVLRKLAYRRFKNVPLYVEWAPLAAKLADEGASADDNVDANEALDEPTSEMEEEIVNDGATSTLYIKNLNFATTEEGLRRFFESNGGHVRAARIPQKTAASKRQVGAHIIENVRSVSMGYGFVEFDSADALRTALRRLNGALLDGHNIELCPSSQRPESSLSTTNEKNPSKLVVRNVPFQAQRKELLQLFGSFGQLKKVRLPKKFDGGHRGFAFVDYLTAKDAAEAMRTLSKTHLYGRHLVIEWAAPAEETDGNIDFLREKAKRDLADDRPKNKKIRFT